METYYLEDESTKNLCMALLQKTGSAFVPVTMPYAFVPALLIRFECAQIFTAYSWFRTVGMAVAHLPRSPLAIYTCLSETKSKPP